MTLEEVRAFKKSALEELIPILEKRLSDEQEGAFYSECLCKECLAGTADHNAALRKRMNDIERDLVYRKTELDGLQ